MLKLTQQTGFPIEDFLGLLIFEDALVVSQKRRPCDICHNEIWTHDETSSPLCLFVPSHFDTRVPFSWDRHLDKALVFDGKVYLAIKHTYIGKQIQNVLCNNWNSSSYVNQILNFCQVRGCSGWKPVSWANGGCSFLLFFSFWAPLFSSWTRWVKVGRQVEW